MSNKAIFFDCDGVLNLPVIKDGRPFPPANADEMIVADGAKQATARARSAGFLNLVVTNQPDIARGKQDSLVVDQINQRLRDELAIDACYVCPHDDVDNCACRKPRPGLLMAAAATWEIDLTRSFMIGDRWRDIGAGINAGVTPILIDYQYDEPMKYQPTKIVSSVGEAVDWILARVEETG